MVAPAKSQLSDGLGAGIPALKAASRSPKTHQRCEISVAADGTFSVLAWGKLKEYRFRIACIKPPELKRREMEEDPDE